LDIYKDVKVAEIASARSWLEFVCAHPYVCGDQVVVDWSEASQKFDGVHITLAAIVAAQGFSFVTDYGVIPPAFWDVESTLWLKWAFPSGRQIEFISDRSPKEALEGWDGKQSIGDEVDFRCRAR
jgi:hypothetical protein